MLACITLLVVIVGLGMYQYRIDYTYHKRKYLCSYKVERRFCVTILNTDSCSITMTLYVECFVHMRCKYDVNGSQ